MKKVITSSFGIFSYIVSFAGLAAFLLFIGGWSFLPIHINSGEPNASAAQAIVMNLLVLVLFGLHHSIAARSGFKKKLTQFIPASIERSAYVLVSGLFMFAICLFWQPLSGELWVIDNQIIALMLTSIHILGWLVLIVASFEIDHFHLMGLKQSFAINSQESKQLKESFLYRIVRNPIQTGFLMCLWSTDVMSMTQLMLSICMTIYIFIGLHYEEKALIAYFGDAYLNYKKRVPSIIPFWPTR